MALTFVQATVNSPAIQTAVATANLPSLATNGDMLVMAIASVTPTSITGVPVGWTFQVGASCGIAFAGLNVRVYTKQASSEPSTYSSTFDASDFYSAHIFCMRGQNGSSSAVDVTASATSVSGTAIVIPSITTTKPNDLWLGMAFQYESATSPAGWDLPAGWTLASQVTSNYPAMVSAYKTLASSGTSGTVIFSVSAGSAFNPSISISMGFLESAGAAVIAIMRNLGLLGAGL